MIKPIRFVCATRFAQEEFLTRTALGRSLSLYGLSDRHQLFLVAKNQLGLPRIYNHAIRDAMRSPAIMVFIHDDVHICDFFWPDRIQEAAHHWDLAGIAGNRRRVARQPAWCFVRPQTWDDPAQLSGTVGHGNTFPCANLSQFGPSMQPCKLLDGVMLIADSDILIQYNLLFDERFQFHFYDMDLCRQAELRGLKIGTWPVSIIHESGGSFNSEAWKQGYDEYLNKYKE